MKRRIIVSIVLGAVGFLLLFGIRLGYGYLSHPEAGPPVDRVVVPGFDGQHARNYASKRLRSKVGAAPLDQKYEKIAELGAGTKAFVDDAARIRAAVKTHGGLIQTERRSGLEQRRVLHLAIGVPPANFDGLLVSLSGIGRTVHQRVLKSDKTNEYRELKARQAALLEARRSLAALQQAPGTIEERIGLENRLLDIQQQIEDLKVSLGEFDTENELNTVRFSLAEQGPTPAAVPLIPWWRRVRVAFDWTVAAYFRLIGIAALCALFGLLGIMAIERAQRLLPS